MKINKIIVKYHERFVGTLVQTKNGKIAFQYSKEWIETGFSLNPFSLPLTEDVFIPGKNNFSGLFGVFADSLPDSWGNLILDRILKKYDRLSNGVNLLERLAIIGNSGMGALTYEPVFDFNLELSKMSLDEINIECKKILNHEETKNIDELFKIGGSSGGARPKVLLKINDTNWLIKFSNHIDGNDAGVIEYNYFECARKCGIDVPQTKLFKSNVNSGYFGIERFDINNDNRVHMVTVAGLLELDYRSPSLDYKDLIKLTKMLSTEADVYEMYRRMCFNVFSHNLDDHTKNFTFIYNEKNRRWRLSPAYDLTYSNTYFGEHTTSVNGKGRDISDSDLLEVGRINRLDIEKCSRILAETKECVNTMLEKYLK